MLGSELHKAAIALAARGIPVFPCVAGTKRPAVRFGFRAATTDRETIDRWWAADDYNVAFSPGDAGWTVLDVDPKNGGDRSFEALELCHGPVETYGVMTPSGGFHYYFKGSTPLSSAGRLGVGLDTRSERGYVLSPPSYTDDGVYEVFNDVEMAETPEWLSSALVARDATREGEDVEPDLPWNVQGYREWLNRQPGAREGTRNDAASTIIGYAFDYGVSKATALPLIYEWGRRCTPPIPEPDEKIEDHGLWRRRQNTGAPMATSLSMEAWAAEKLDLDTSMAIEESPHERFYLWSVAELIARPPPEWLIQDIVAERAIGHFYGLTGSYKSYVTAALCYDLGAPVVYGVGEGEDTFGWRVRALEIARQQAHGIKVAASLPLIVEPGDVAEFIQAMKRQKFSPRIVVLDTLSVVMESLDESTAKDMGRFVAAMKLIRSELNTAVIAIHHRSDKPAATGERGSSVLKAGVDFSAEIEGFEKEKAAKLTMTKQRASERRKQPFGFSGATIPVGRESPELVFSPLPLEEFDDLVKSRVPGADIAAILAERGWVGPENGITTQILASVLRAPIPDERASDAEAAVAKLRQDLDRRAVRDLGTLAHGTGTARRWYVSSLAGDVDPTA